MITVWICVHSLQPEKSRIKKIMQADEDVGKIASAVPVLVSKALELFLQDLCDRTYEVTLQRGVKTMSSLHLKQCVHNCQVFDFLKDIVSKVPDLGGSDVGGDDRSLKQRITADEGNDSDEDFKQSKTEMMAGQSGTGNSSRGRGRGRGRGRPRGSGRGGDRARYDRFEDDPETSTQHNIDNKSHDLKFSEEGLDARQQKETLDGTSGTAGGDDSSLKRRKTADEGNDSDENFKRSKTEVMARQSSTSSSSRGRGRGRGRGRPRGSGRGGVRARYDRFEDDPETSPQHNIDNQPHDFKFSEEGLDARQQKETLDGTSSTAAGAAHNFDLNLELDENGDTSTAASKATGSATPSATATDRNEMKHEEYACWPLSDMDKMAIDPLKVSLFSNRIEEEEEDYDNEEG